MLAFARNLPTPQHQVRPPIQFALGQLGAVQMNMRSVTSPINTSAAASNAAYANGNDSSNPSTPAPDPTSSVALQPLPPVGHHRHHHGGQSIGLTPLGWGVVLISAFAIYKTFIARP